MRYSKLDVFRKFRNVFFTLMVIFLAVVVADGYKVLKADGSFSDFTNRLVSDPGLALPFIITLMFWLTFLILFRIEKSKQRMDGLIL